MRLALLQIRIGMPSLSANLTHVLRQVVGAVDSESPPDLVVLPAGCDGPVHSGLSAAMVQGFGESLASVAREWGVYLAAGLLRPDGESFAEAARVYDPDGAVVVRSTGAGAVGNCVLRETGLGRLAVGLDLDDAPMAPPADTCDLLLIHGRWSAPLKQRRQARAKLHDRFSKLARRIGAPVCAVGAVGAPDHDGESSGLGGSGLWAPDGGCILAAGPGAEETLLAEVADCLRQQSGT